MFQCFAIGPQEKTVRPFAKFQISCELTLHLQHFPGPLSTPWAPLWQDCPCVLQCADADREWPSAYV